MIRKKKRLVFWCLTIIMTLGIFVIPAYADAVFEFSFQEVEFTHSFDEMDLNNIIPVLGNISPNPPTSNWNVQTMGEYRMTWISSAPSSRVLYSAHILSGKNDYSITIQNRHQSDFTMSVVMRRGNIITTTPFVIQGMGTSTIGIRASNPNDTFYLQFTGAQLFAGSVR